MNYPPAVDAQTERDVLAGLALERHAALKLYPHVSADVFLGHRLHPFIFATLRRLHTTGGGAVIPGDPWRFEGFEGTFDAAYPAAGYGPGQALALLNDCIKDSGLLWYYRVNELLELRERRRLLAQVEARLTPARSIVELDELDRLGAYLADRESGPITAIWDALAAVGVTVTPWEIPGWIG